MPSTRYKQLTDVFRKLYPSQSGMDFLELRIFNHYPFFKTEIQYVNQSNE